MALSKTYYTRMNVPVADFSTSTNLMKSIVWALKAFMKGEISTGTVGSEGDAPSSSYWTVEASSDSVSANLAGSDLWTSTFNASKIVRAAAGVAHSWIVLKSPAALGPFYVCIDIAGAADTTAMSIFASKTAFSTGGTITARPTSATEWTVMPNGSTFFEAVNQAYSVHYICDANGAFTFHTSKNSAGIFSGLVAMLPLIGTKPSEAHNLFGAWHHFTSSRGAPTGTGIAWNGRTYNNGAVMSGGMQASTFGGQAFAGSIGANAADGSKWDVLPVILGNVNASAAGIRGQVPDVGIVGTPAVGASDPSTSAQERFVAGDFLFPGSVVPIL